LQEPNTTEKENQSEHEEGNSSATKSNSNRRITRSMCNRSVAECNIFLYAEHEKKIPLIFFVYAFIKPYLEE
jgi:hypothetical protein